MTVWAPEAIAVFAGRAGWAGYELAVAVGVALASSNGKDHITIAVPPPPVHEYVGLWLVPITEDVGRTISELRDPYVNAAAARRLWLLEGGGWSWSPTWQSGRWQWRMTEAERAIQRPRLPTATGVNGLITDVGAMGAMLDLNIQQSRER